MSLFVAMKSTVHGGGGGQFDDVHFMDNLYKIKPEKNQPNFLIKKKEQFPHSMKLCYFLDYDEFQTSVIVKYFPVC